MRLAVPPRPLAATLLAVAFAAPASALVPIQEPPPQAGPLAPLFRDQAPLRLRIEADFRGLRGDREDENEEREGTLVLLGDDGTESPFPLEIRTRGRFRLQSNVCRFPPLRLDVPRSQMDGTPFEGQDKLKLVTHCRDEDRYEQNTLKEYLVYRIYNLLTDLSFQVRLARITYLDTSGQDDTVERWGFVIESEEALAERLGAPLVEASPDGIHPAQVLGADEGRVALFAFMVGNTDFSIYGQHNVVGFDPPEGLVIPVPYDFDWTGLVGAPYARPDPSLGTRNVRQRVFRGLCRPGMDYPGLYADFLAHREAVTALVRDEPRLEDDVREDVLDYLDGFWEILEDPGKAAREIERSCRSLSGGVP